MNDIAKYSRKNFKRLCSIPECMKKHRCQGYCSVHYYRFRRNGDPLVRKTNSNEECLEWIFDHVNHTDDSCLIWPFRREKKGYAADIRQDGIDKRPTRIMCELVNGKPQSPDLHAAHICGKGHLGCINPRHLLWKTPKENSDDLLVHGTRIFGEKIAKSKLKSEDVLEIFHNKSLTQKQLAKRYCVSKSAICFIKSGRTWNHITGLPLVRPRDIRMGMA